MQWLENFFEHENSGVFVSGAEYLYKTGHWVFLAISIPSLVILIYLLRNANKEKVEKILFWVWLGVTISEFLKVIWMSIASHEPFDFAGRLSLYPCSTFMYVVPFVLFSKNEKLKQSALAYTTTFLLFGGLINFFLPDVLRSYPVLSFEGLHTLLYHYAILFISILLWVTNYYQPKKKDARLAFMMLLIFSAPIILLDKIFREQGFNYFWFNDGGTTPLNILSNIFTNHWLWMLIMLVLYYILIKLFYIPLYIIEFYQRRNLKQN